MLKRKKVFAAIQVGPGTGAYATPSVRAIRVTAKAAERAQTADRERFPDAEEHFAHRIVEAEVLTVDGFPRFGLVVLGRTSEEDRADLHATVLNGTVGAAWADWDSMSGLLMRLMFSAMGPGHILRTNPDRSPNVAQVIPFLLAVQRELGLGFSASTNERLVEWAGVGEHLHQLWRSTSDWWWQWCQAPELEATSTCPLELRVDDGFVVVFADKGYANTVWSDEASATNNATGPNRYGHEFAVVPTPVIRSGLYLQIAAAGHAYGEVFHATVFRLPLPETGVDPEDEWLRPLQMCIWGRGRTREQAWLRILHHMFQETLVHFPEFPPRMYNLPLSGLAREGYRVPDPVRQRLAAWARNVEQAQKTYLAAAAAVKDEMPR